MQNRNDKLFTLSSKCTFKYVYQFWRYTHSLFRTKINSASVPLDILITRQPEARYISAETPPCVEIELCRPEECRRQCGLVASIIRYIPLITPPVLRLSVYRYSICICYRRTSYVFYRKNATYSNIEK